jgi:hypothetical protein
MSIVVKVPNGTEKKFRAPKIARAILSILGPGSLVEIGGEEGDGASLVDDDHIDAGNYRFDPVVPAAPPAGTWLTPSLAGWPLGASLVRLGFVGVD